jgi:hypothetical protein
MKTKGRCGKLGRNRGTTMPPTATRCWQFLGQDDMPESQPAMAVAHARQLTGTQKPGKRAKRLGVRRLDAAFALATAFQGGVKPPHSTAPSAQPFSEQR